MRTRARPGRTSLDEVSIGNARQLPVGISLSMRRGGRCIRTKEGPRVVAEVQVHKGKILEDHQDEGGSHPSYRYGGIDFLDFVIKGSSLK
jgi:hypothetical protein